MTQALDAEAAAAAVVAFPSSSSPTAAHTEASFALQASIDALTPSDGLQVTDDILRQLMETRGTRDGRVLQEMLSMAPYNVNASYEVVQRRVKKLLDEESSAIIVHTFPDNAVNTPEDDEKEKTREINAEEDTDKVENQVGKEKETAEDQVHEKAARDLDMLADTVRSIVTDVEEAETTLVDGGDDAIETQSNVVGDVEVEVETQSADGKSGADKPSMDRNFTDVVQLDKVGMAKTAQDTTDAVIAVGLPSSNPREVCNGAPATEGNVTKRPVTNEGKSDHKPKRQKRAEYSVETRALCIKVQLQVLWLQKHPRHLRKVI
ncbi:hypothetical protein C6341_g8430 [Phytophthora cactorum]|nr:hypothetical protein C6341_g8430 [Phytophthora cactorum]